MSKIQIDDLQPTGTELFQGSESFLTELKSVEANAIYGGKGNSRKTGKSSGSKTGKSSGSKIGRSGKSSGKNYGHICPPPIGGD
jgi:hypothetical protein